MSEQRAIARELVRASRGGESVVLASVVRTVGATYRGVGARMIVRADNTTVGLLSGGCLEGELVERAMRVRERGAPEVVSYDGRSGDELIWGLGLGCNGLVEILLRPATGTTRAGSVAWVTAAVLFAIFGVGSLAFREYFARHLPADQDRVALAAKIITQLRDSDGRSEAGLAALINVELRHVHATIDRLERANWIRRDKAFQVTDSEVPLHLSTPARALHESGRVGWFSRRRLVLGLTRADRDVLAHLFAAQRESRAAKRDNSTPP